MRYYAKYNHIGIGAVLLPGRKNRSLVYIDGNTETVIGTVTNYELFEKGMENMIGHLITDWRKEKNGTDDVQNRVDGKATGNNTDGT